MARKRHQKQAGAAGATKQSGATHSYKKTKMTELHKVLLLEKYMKMQMAMAKQVINYLERMKIMAITMLRTIRMIVTGPCRWHPIFPPNLTQRTSTRYWVSP